MNTHVIVRELNTVAEGRRSFRELVDRAAHEYRLTPLYRADVAPIPAYVLVADIDNDIIGFGQVEFTRNVNDPQDCDTLTDVFVLPEHRRRGVGRAIVSALLASSQTGVVSALCSPADVATKGFLRACGFDTREAKGILLEQDRQAFWHLSHEVRAANLEAKAAEQRRLAEEQEREAKRRAHRDDMWDLKMGWRNEQERRRNGKGTPRLLIAGQTLDYIEVLTHPFGTGQA